ncbi:hypothetical protein QYF36_027113 [Acer negundo]|nr:hypothetical protein QYF36_027113 [Acer negundo]
MSDQLSISRCFSSSIVSYLIVQSLNHFQMEVSHLTFFSEHYWMPVAVRAVSTEPKGGLAHDFSSCLQGGSLLPAYLQGLLDKLTSGEFVEFFLRVHKLVPLVETILTVNTVLDDADEKQFKNPAVRRWHNELIEVTYDLGDLMEEINTEIKSLDTNISTASTWHA